MTDEVIKEQTRLGIIEKISDIENFKEEFPAHNYLPHMNVFIS